MTTGIHIGRQSAIALLLIALSFLFYAADAHAGSAALINYQPIKKTDADDGWRPLSPAEMTKRTLELTFKAAEAGAEAADSLKMAYVSERLFDIIDKAHQVINFRERFSDKFHMRLELKGEQALLLYKKRY